MYQLRWRVQGYHVYRDEWDAAIGEELERVREKNNLKDPYAVAMMCNNIVVGHLPRKIPRICTLFMKRRGIIRCGRKNVATLLIYPKKAYVENQELSELNSVGVQFRDLTNGHASHEIWYPTKFPRYTVYV